VPAFEVHSTYSPTGVCASSVPTVTPALNSVTNGTFWWKAPPTILPPRIIW